MTSLFSIITTKDRVFAVGGSTEQGVILEYANGSWGPVPGEILGTQRGLAANGDDVYAVGELGTLARRDAAGWIQTSARVTQKTFHAAWADSSGGLWGVGGEFDRIPLTSNGFLTYYGTKQPRSIE